MAYWLPNIPGVVWSVIFLVVILGLNLFSVKGYGKLEYCYVYISR